MLTPDLLSWTLGATVGINRWSSERNAKTDFEHCRVATEEGKAKFSKKFAIDKQAQKVSGKNLTVIDDEGETEQTNTNTGEQGGGSNPPSGELEG